MSEMISEDSRVFQILKGIWRRSRIFNWSILDRDKWVRDLAAKIPPGSVVLDVGAGTAPYRDAFTHCTYKTQDTGLNVSSENRYGDRYGNLDYNCDILNIPAPDASFEVILCTEVLEHTPEPILALRELARLLKNDGTLIISFPLWSQVHQAPYHFYGGFTPYWIERFFPEAGFVIENIQKQGGFFKYYGLNSVRFARMLNPTTLFRSRIAQLFYLPLWAMIVAWYALFTPTICFFLDRLDKTLDWTLGYMIIARRERS